VTIILNLFLVDFVVAAVAAAAAVVVAAAAVHVEIDTMNRMKNIMVLK
jgi:hypothetical protein